MLGRRDDIWTELLALVPDFSGLTGQDAETPPEVPAPEGPREDSVNRAAETPNNLP